MKEEIKDFIGVYSGVYPEGFCDHLINEFNDLKNGGAGSNRLKSENAPAHIKDDFQIIINASSHPLSNFQSQPSKDLFFNGLQNCFDSYTRTFSTLLNQQIKTTSIKLQKTIPGGGYHVWHSEQGNDLHSARVLVYMLYLNTLNPENAGETEFLYQQTRIRPVENTMLIWPAAYTHVHRGNAVFGNASKYVATGWFYYE
jgi:hypothetical protein